MYTHTVEKTGYMERAENIYKLYAYGKHIWFSSMMSFTTYYNNSK